MKIQEIFKKNEIVLFRDNNEDEWLIGSYKSNRLNCFAVNDYFHDMIVKYSGNECYLNTNTNIPHWELIDGKLTMCKS